MDGVGIVITGGVSVVNRDALTTLDRRRQSQFNGGARGDDTVDRCAHAIGPDGKSAWRCCIGTETVVIVRVLVPTQIRIGQENFGALSVSGCRTKPGKCMAHINAPESSEGGLQLSL